MNQNLSFKKLGDMLNRNLFFIERENGIPYLVYSQNGSLCLAEVQNDSATISRSKEFTTEILRALFSRDGLSGVLVTVTPKGIEISFHNVRNGTLELLTTYENYALSNYMATMITPSKFLTLYNFDSNQIFVLGPKSGKEITFNEIPNLCESSLGVLDDEKQRFILYFYESNEFYAYSVRETDEADFPMQFVNISKFQLDTPPPV